MKLAEDREQERDFGSQSNLEGEMRSAVAPPRLRGMCLATCCHHVCSWDDYVNKEFFLSGGFTPADFAMMLRMSSWGTCGFGRTRTARTTSAAVAKECGDSILDTEKIAIGQRCKMALDIGRLLFLQRHGFRCEMRRYVPGALTPENRLLVATLP